MLPKHALVKDTGTVAYDRNHGIGDQFSKHVRCSCFAVQERMTKQIAVAVTEALRPCGVGVVIEATYFS